MADRLIRRFTEVLGLLDSGKFEKSCNEHLTRALETLEALPSEKGKATITVEMKIVYDGGQLSIDPKIKSKLPEDAFRSTPFWSMEGAISVEHPRQSDMFARDVSEREHA